MENPLCLFRQNHALAIFRAIEIHDDRAQFAGVDQVADPRQIRPGAVRHGDVGIAARHEQPRNFGADKSRASGDQSLHGGREDSGG